jgi:hypothetical protein
MSHQRCKDAGEHVCQVPSGRVCVDCDQPAGTSWGPYWCPPCDEKRLDKCTAGLDAALAGLSEVTP